MQYAQVAVDSPAPLKTYSYLIPPHLSGLAVGQAVWVPFGRASGLIQGIVFGFSDEAPAVELKPVSSAIEALPPLGPAARRLAEWLSDYYYAPLFECAALMMPPGFRQRVKTLVEAVAAPAPVAGARPPFGERVLGLLWERGGPVDLGYLRRRFGRNVDAAIERLVTSGRARRVSELSKPSAGARYARRFVLTEAGRSVDLSEERWKRRPRRAAVMAHLQAAGSPVGAADLTEAVGQASAAIRELVREGLVAMERERVIRDPLTGRAFQETSPPVLTEAQGIAFEAVRRSLDGTGPRSFLLHGVTGSGKTEVYLRALESCVAAGKKGIVLVPEIALEPQMVARFSARFPGRVAVLHSGVSAGEAYDEWWRIQAGEFDVVIGSRGAVFAPQPDLGLMVIDEEHEATYKEQESAPRYDARRAALERALLEGATVVLGSATPDLETYHAAEKGKLGLLTLRQRVGTGRATAGRGLAAVEVVDLREELRAGNRSIFSRPLQEALGRALAGGSQAILFLNRRGTSTFVQCRDCGEVVRCRRCETPLTYHGAEERLICHQCNAQRRVPSRCAACGSGRVRYLGAGTQRVEAEVAALFPSARLLRWDRDTARNRRAHEELLGRFARGEADVLVGTQMIAKGLDLPQVTVVGVVNADLNLYLPDFRAAERTFQLLTQVAGRAGRGELPGSVIIQTYTPDHYAIQAAARQDYEGFAGQELAFRARHGYPPAQPLVRLVYSDPDGPAAQKEAASYTRALMQERARMGLGVQVSGPLPGFFRRVRGRYRWQVLLKGLDARELLQRCPAPRNWVVDVDPLHIL